jgi:uncharacterized glyoxalase superfamily protein PhnB
MSIPYKPAGYTSVAPYLIVDNARRTIEFLVAVFGAERLRSYPNPDGSLAHAEVRVGDTVVMLSDGSGGWPPLPCHVHVYVEDVDAVYRRALEAGAEPIQPPIRKDDEDKRGGFREPGGTTWWVATQVA